MSSLGPCNVFRFVVVSLLLALARGKSLSHNTQKKLGQETPSRSKTWSDDGSVRPKSRGEAAAMMLTKKKEEERRKKMLGQELVQLWAHDECVNNVRTVSSLIQKGADVNAKDADGMTVLMNAANCPYTDIVTLLITSGAELAATDGTDDVIGGRTAMHYAAYYDRLENVRILDKKAPDLYKVRSSRRPGLGALPGLHKGNTAMHVAASFGYRPVVAYLDQAHREDLYKIKNNDGNTAMHLAALYGKFYQVVALDVAHGDLYNIPNNDGKKPGDVAAIKGYIGIVAYLESKHSDALTPGTPVYLTQARGTPQEPAPAYDTLTQPSPPEYIAIELGLPPKHKVLQEGILQETEI